MTHETEDPFATQTLLGLAEKRKVITTTVGASKLLVLTLHAVHALAGATVSSNTLENQEKHKPP